MNLKSRTWFAIDQKNHEFIFLYSANPKAPSPAMARILYSFFSRLWNHLRCMHLNSLMSAHMTITWDLIKLLCARLKTIKLILSIFRHWELCTFRKALTFKLQKTIKHRISDRQIWSNILEPTCMHELRFKCIKCQKHIGWLSYRHFSNGGSVWWIVLNFPFLLKE